MSKFKVGDKVVARIYGGEHKGTIAYTEDYSASYVVDFGEVLKFTHSCFTNRYRGLERSTGSWCGEEELTLVPEDLREKYLQPGNVAETRKGELFIITKTRMVAGVGFIWLNNVDNNLCSTFYREHDIVRIFSEPLKLKVLNDGEVLWERKEPKKVTISEIQEKFGCEVEIVEG